MEEHLGRHCRRRYGSSALVITHNESAALPTPLIVGSFLELGNNGGRPHPMVRASACQAYPIGSTWYGYCFYRLPPATLLGGPKRWEG
jgi:hypothetical protein